MSKNSLKNIELRDSYDPCKDGTDLVSQFYNPCLSNSIRYDRIAAYFSTSVLKLYSEGLINLFINGGHARYIISSETDASDINEISKAYLDKMNTISDSLNNDELEDDYNIANLSYLIKHNLVDIKVAFMIKNNTSLMHIKSGLFADEDGNKVFFTGSGNETENGIKNNAEFFMVFNNFNGDNKTVDIGEDMFEELWNNTYAPSSIIAITPEGKLFEKLISYDKGRTFDSQQEYETFIKCKDCFYLDIDIKNNSILLYDFTNDKIIKNPRTGITSMYQDRLKSSDNDLYVIDKITVTDLKEVIPGRAKRVNKEIITSDEANTFLENEDLNLKNTIKLARRIKNNEDTDLWEDSYNHFKDVIDKETITKLKEAQYKNAYHHYSIKSAMDFSVPGTGKTYISYGLFAYLNSKINKEQEADHLVVFGPLNCFNTWKEECTKIFGPNRFKIFDITECKDNFEKKIAFREYNIYLINYEFLNDDKKVNLIADNILDEKAMVVFDEIHRIKSATGVRANHMKNLFNRAVLKPKYKLALTGTPIPNSFRDLKNYIELLYSDDLNSLLSDFSESMLKLADTNEFYASEIQEELFPLFTRTTKVELNIPAANEDDLSTLSTIPTSDEEELFQLVYKSYRNPLVKFIRLIQASSNPKLLMKKIDESEINSMYDENIDFGADEVALYRDDIEKVVNRIHIASKTKATLELIENKVRDGKKIIVWCLFIDTINLVLSELNKKGIQSISITGSDDISERNKKLKFFKEGDTQVLVTNPNTLAESVSLHLVCHDAIYLEYGFNLTYMLQSKDRIHRVGLPEGTETNYYYAISNSQEKYGSIDQRIYKRLEEKNLRMKNAIESNQLLYVSNPSERDEIIDIINEMDSAIKF